MKKNFMYQAKCNHCEWESGFSVKTHIDDEVKRHRAADCKECSHPDEMVLKYPLLGKETCALCNQIIKEHY